MRRVFMFILLLCTVFCFAEIDVTVTGSSEVTYGVDLDELATGFSPVLNTSTLQFDFGKGEDVEKSGADIYGYIKLSGFGVSVNNELTITPPVVEAKLMTTSLWVLISTAPETKVNYVNPVEDDDGDDDAVDEGVSVDMGKSGGITIGYNTDTFYCSVGVVSEHDWIDDEPDPEWGWVDDDDDPETPPVWGVVNEDDIGTDDINNEGAYGFSGKAGYTSDIFDVEVMGVIGLDYVDSVPAAVGGKVAVKPGNFTITCMSDVSIDEETLFEIGGGVSYSFVKGLDLSCNVTYNESDDVDTSCTLVESSGDEGAIKIVGFSLGCTVYNVTLSSIGWATDNTLDFTIGDVKPYFSGGYGDDEVLNLGCGIVLSMIENTEITLDYTTSDIFESNGIITMKMKISY